MLKNNSIIKKINNKGMIALSLAFVLSAIIVIAVSIITMTIFREIKIGEEIKNASIAFYLAETGIEKAKHRVLREGICKSMLDPPTICLDINREKCFRFDAIQQGNICNITAYGSFREINRTLTASVPFPPLPLAVAIVEFTADTRIALTGEPENLFIRLNSRADRLEVSGPVLTANVPSGSSFTLGTLTRNVLGITPSDGGTVVLTFDTGHFGIDSFIDQWTLRSDIINTRVDLLIGVPLPNRYYLIRVDGVKYGFFKADALGYVSFTYIFIGGLPERIFTIEQKDRP